MDLDITVIDQNEWDAHLGNCSHSSFFHQYTALTLLANETGSRLHTIAGYRNQELIGLFPIFAKTVGGLVTVVFSPPPDLETNLGPVLSYPDTIKQRKKERWHTAFIEQSLQWIDATVQPRYITIGTTATYTDVRPFLWNGFDAEPSYTYRLDLTPGADALFSNSSSDLRSNIRKVGTDDYAIREGGPDDIDRIVSQIRRRYRAQGERYWMDDSALVRNLYQHLPDGTVRPYTLTVDGSFVGGIIVLEHGETIHRWIGGSKASVSLPVNDLLDWHIIKEGISRGMKQYNLVGAIERRLTEYKAKFNPEPAVVFKLSRASVPMRFGLELYHHLSGHIPTRF